MLTVKYSLSWYNINVDARLFFLYTSLILPCFSRHFSSNQCLTMRVFIVSNQAGITQTAPELLYGIILVMLYIMHISYPRNKKLWHLSCHLATTGTVLWRKNIYPGQSNVSPDIDETKREKGKNRRNTWQIIWCQHPLSAENCISHNKHPLSVSHKDLDSIIKWHRLPRTKSCQSRNGVEQKRESNDTEGYRCTHTRVVQHVVNFFYQKLPLQK